MQMLGIPATKDSRRVSQNRTVLQQICSRP
jgi:hypothetical protein